MGAENGRSRSPFVPWALALLAAVIIGVVGFIGASALDAKERTVKNETQIENINDDIKEMREDVKDILRILRRRK